MDVSPVVYGGNHDLSYRLTRDKLALLTKSRNSPRGML